MKTFTRNSAAKNLGITPNHLLYWERQGKLKPKKLKIGDRGLIVYDEKMVEKARKIFTRKKRGKK